VTFELQKWRVVDQGSKYDKDEHAGELTDFFKDSPADKFFEVDVRPPSLEIGWANSFPSSTRK